MAAAAPLRVPMLCWLAAALARLLRNAIPGCCWLTLPLPTPSRCHSVLTRRRRRARCGWRGRGAAPRRHSAPGSWGSAQSGGVGVGRRLVMGSSEAEEVVASRSGVWKSVKGSRAGQDEGQQHGWGSAMCAHRPSPVAPPPNQTAQAFASKHAELSYEPLVQPVPTLMCALDTSTIMLHLRQPPGGTAAEQVSEKERVRPVLLPAVRAKLYSKLSSSLPMPGMLRLVLVPTLRLLVADQLTVSCSQCKAGASASVNRLGSASRVEWRRAREAGIGVGGLPVAWLTIHALTC